MDSCMLILMCHAEDLIKLWWYFKMDIFIYAVKHETLCLSNRWTLLFSVGFLWERNSWYAWLSVHENWGQQSKQGKNVPTFLKLTKNELFSSLTHSHNVPKPVWVSSEEQKRRCLAESQSPFTFIGTSFCLTSFFLCFTEVCGMT